MTPAETIGQDPNIDQSVWRAALASIGCYMSSAANEFVQCIMAVVLRTYGGPSYEKCAQFIQIMTEDPSTLTANKDTVASSRRAGIRAGNLTGRVFCDEIVPIIEAGADGTALGQELGMANNGSDQWEFDTPTTKILRSCVPQEFGSTGHVTAVEYITGTAGRPRFYHGVMARQGAFLDMANARVWAIRKYGGDEESYYVTADGRVMASGLIVSGREVVTRRVRAEDGSVVEALVLL